MIHKQIHSKANQQYYLTITVTMLQLTDLLASMTKKIKYAKLGSNMTKYRDSVRLRRPQLLNRRWPTANFFDGKLDDRLDSWCSE